MLAPATMPENFAIWNREYKAPKGAQWWIRFRQPKLRGTRRFRRFIWHNRMSLPYWLTRES